MKNLENAGLLDENNRNRRNIPKEKNNIYPKNVYVSQFSI